MSFHLQRGQTFDSADTRRIYKEELVRSGRAHGALVFDDGDVVGWCQFGPPGELPARMGGYARLGAPPPDWRITCFFVDRDRRGEGVADAALSGALRLIGSGGGGTVDGYPVAVGDRPYSSSFLWGGTESMFAAAGFRKVGALGESKLLMRRRVRSS